MSVKKETIGAATLYLGDAREVIPGLPEIDFVFMDPPYGHGNNDGDLIANWEKALGRLADPERCKSRPILNDRAEATPMLRDVLVSLAAKLADDSCCCCCCCCGGGGPDPQFAWWSLLMDEVMSFKHAIVWDKGPMGMGWHYRRSYEMVLVAQKKKGKARWYAEENNIENVIRPNTFANKIIPSRDQHPTEKPEGLAAHFIRLHSLPGHTVCDPFMGSGSTGAAAVKMGRKFIGIELDPQFFDMACERLDAAQKQQSLAL